MSLRLFTLSLAAAAFAAAQGPPPSPVHPVTDTLHGVVVTDPYRWLEDQNSPETRAWLDAQMQYTQNVLSRIPVREKIEATSYAAQPHRFLRYAHRTAWPLLLQPAPGKRESRLHLHAHEPRRPRRSAGQPRRYRQR